MFVLLALGVVLTLSGLFVLYHAYRVRQGDESRPTWHRTVGRVIRGYHEPGVPILGPAPNVPETYWIEYEFEAGGARHRERQRVRESYVVRVRGLTRRLGSLQEGAEVPVWYSTEQSLQSTLMPGAVAGTILSHHVGWSLLLVGLTTLGIALAAI